MKQHFSRTVRINRPVSEVFAWHENPAALARLNPPWETIKVVEQSGGIGNGARVVLKSKVGPVWTTWEMEHFDYLKDQQFCDRQIAGPFKSWTHMHRFNAIGEDACELIDEIHFELPGGILGGLGAGFGQGKLEQLFRYRHMITKWDLESPVKRNPGRVVISGASGLIGQALVPFLRMRGWTVNKLVRRAVQANDEIQWDPAAGTVNWPSGYAADALIHLAGANVAGGRWTAKRKDAIRRSRVEGTRTLAKAIAAMKSPPRVWLSGSATGFYGDRGEVVLAEDAGLGAGFLAEVCAAWERETDAVAELGVRVVRMRTGIVLSPAGGALGKMLPAFQGGIGGPLGDGMQWMSCIGIEDWLRACAHLLDEDQLAGPVNLVAPGAVRNGDFTRVLGKILNRPAILPVPEMALKWLFGQMADEALLASTRGAPTALLASGFEFLHPELEKMLRHVLGKRSNHG